MERLEQSAGLDRALEALPDAKVLQERHAAGVGLDRARARGAARLHEARAPAGAGRVRRARRSVPPRRLRRLLPARAAHRVRARAGLAPPPARDRFDRRRQRGREPRRDQLPLAPVRRDRHAAAGPRACARRRARRVRRRHDVGRRSTRSTSWCPAATQDEMFLAVRRLVERAAALARASRLAPLDLGPTVGRFQPGVRAVVDALPDVLVGRVAEAAAAERDRLQAAGVPARARTRVATSEAALAALPAVDARAPPRRRAASRWSRGTTPCSTIGSGSTGSATASPTLPRADRWQTEARAALRDDFYDRSARSPRRSSPRPTARARRRAGRRLARRARRPSTGTATWCATSTAPTSSTSPRLAVARRAAPD